jgi:phosphate:Na+ symporter
MFLKIAGVIGSVFLFLYGMRAMSDALQKVSGQRMRSLVSKFTNTRSKGFFSGLFLTSLLQTSSASTLLIVGLVNAGIITFVSALPLVIGANVGTTIKLWLISFLGFQFDISKYALIFVLFGFPMLFWGHRKIRHLGEFFIGLSVMFLGLFFMKSIFEAPSEESIFYSWIQDISASTYASVFVFVLIGFIITAILQSSSATITLTFVLCYHEVIDFPLAVAMVLGENIGTTITANLGAIVANYQSKRIAFSHFLMNFLIVIMIIPFFYPLVHSSGNIIENVFQIDLSSPAHIPIGLAFIHTVFNLTLAIIMLPATEYIVKLVEKIIPVKSSELNYTRFYDNRFFDSNEIALLYVKADIARFSESLSKSIQSIPLLFLEKKDNKFNDLYSTIKQIQKETDIKHSEISKHLGVISEKEISSNSSFLIMAMLDIMYHLENISYIALQTAKTIDNKNKKDAWFHQQMREDISQMFGLIQKAYDVMKQNLYKDFSEVNINEALEIEQKIDELRNTLQNKQKQKLMNEVPIVSHFYYDQIIILTERMGDYIFHVTKSIVTARNIKTNNQKHKS